MDGPSERQRLIHDLKGCLAVVSGQVEMLSQGLWGPMSEEQQRAVASIGRQVERMGQIAERLRALDP